MNDERSPSNTSNCDFFFFCSKEELGSVSEEVLENSRILINSEDFQKGLETLQSVQSLDLGAPKVNMLYSQVRHQRNPRFLYLSGIKYLQENIFTFYTKA